MTKSKFDICIMGLGYIGLPTALTFASQGAKVLGVDKNKDVVESLEDNQVHISEPGIQELMSSPDVSSNFRVSAQPAAADAYIITVPTPFDDSAKMPDISYVKSAIITIADYLDAGSTVIIESTSPVGTTDEMLGVLSELRPDLVFPPSLDSNIRVAYCPERVLPGRTLEELVVNTRIIGGVTDACAAAAAKVYSIFLKGDVVLTNCRTAEMAKLTENSYRDVNIAFANELSIICDEHDIDVWELIRLANRHPRVDILEPGPGVGGALHRC
ncbi:nucleotide sugar dehydrogenase [Luminiphilus sp.]|nr:nucleotide sugar dehydrogenase [Luminiphilus sp.]